MTHSNSRLSAQVLTKTFGQTRALDNVSLEIADGGIVAILGQNGAGKTTFIRCVLGLERPSSGAATVFGDRAGSQAARQRIGVMLQDSDLPDLLTARELVTLFASYYPKPLDVEETLSVTDILPFADTRYKKLSGGQKRRVQFAVATIGNPDILFLDEPTTGLDIEARKSLWEIVRRFSSEGKTIVLTTHYLEEADALADRIIVFAEGEVLEDAPAEQIRQRLGGVQIRCRTKLAADALLALPECEGVEFVGELAVLRCRDAVVTLRALLTADETLTDLTVTRPALEDIFTELTR